MPVIIRYLLQSLIFSHILVLDDTTNASKFMSNSLSLSLSL